MKKAIAIILTAATITAPVQAAHHTRKAAGTFTSPHIIRTMDGHKWKVSRASKPGRRVKVVFDTRNTRNKRDDIIIGIKGR